MHAAGGNFDLMFAIFADAYGWVLKLGANWIDSAGGSSYFFIYAYYTMI